MENGAEILAEEISGFHRYCLEPPARMTYVSRNLCRMLGAEIRTAADYLQLVHPEDRETYTAFLDSLFKAVDSGTCAYRLVKPNGEILSVCDTIHTGTAPDGRRMGSSVLSDITAVQAENQELRFLNDTIPCGFLKYSCEKQPKVTYLNDRMLKILRFPEDPEERRELLALSMENIYTLIPVEERRRFARYLERVEKSGVPLAGELTLQRCDGAKAHLFGWVTKTRNARGEAEFQSVCMDITEKYQARREAEMNRYLSALHDVYDKIFEYDFAANAVTCIYGPNSPMFQPVEHIPMQMREATRYWLKSTVCPEDQNRVFAFFEDFFQKKRTPGQMPQIRYRARASDGQLKNYQGLFLKVDDNTSLFCCRNLENAWESLALQSENDALKSMNENMQALMLHFTDGIAAFEISGDLVTPLYASDNICGFFGFSREEWLGLMRRKTPIPEFIRRCGMDYEAFGALLTQGEAEFTYPDLNSGQVRRIKAVCSQKSPEPETNRYVLLYNLDAEPEAETPRVFIRTFGYFDVFVEGRPIAFRIQKAKELLALLVDRQGGYVTSDEAIGCLWPEEPANAVTLARYRKVALRLKNILEEYGISRILESVDGKRRIVPEQVQCDLYQYLSGKPEHAQLFKGSYLNNYSWAEITLGTLMGEHIYE